MTQKKLITDETVRTALQAGQTTLAVPPDAIITPLARDTAREQGLSFVPEPSSDLLHEDHRFTTGIVALGSDHGGFAYKNTLTSFVEEQGWQILDVGTQSEASCDYPDFAFAVARAVALGKADVGIMIDGAGIGSAMVCNKVPGVLAACAYNEFTAWNARAHNDANVLTLGSRSLGLGVCQRIVATFLDTRFEGGRHARRVGKISDVEDRFLANNS